MICDFFTPKMFQFYLIGMTIDTAISPTKSTAWLKSHYKLWRKIEEGFEPTMNRFAGDRLKPLGHSIIYIFILHLYYINVKWGKKIVIIIYKVGE